MATCWPVKGECSYCKFDIPIKIFLCMYGIAICYLSMCASTVLKQNCVLQIPTMNLKCLFAFPSVLKTPSTANWALEQNFGLCALLDEIPDLYDRFPNCCRSIKGMRSSIQVVTEQLVSCTCFLNVVMSCYDNVEGGKLLLM